MYRNREIGIFNSCININVESLLIVCLQCNENEKNQKLFSSQQYHLFLIPS